MVAVVLAQDFCFFKLENGSPSASKQEKMDMLLTMIMGQLRWSLCHWRDHRSRGGVVRDLQDEKRSKTERMPIRAHVSGGIAALRFAHTAPFFRLTVVGSSSHRCSNLRERELL